MKDAEFAARPVQTGSGEAVLRPAAVAESSVPGVGLDDKGRPVPMGKMERVQLQRGSPVSEPVQATTRRPGELDILAQNVTNASSTWLSSIFGRSSTS